MYASAVSYSDVSTSAPSPVRSRSRSAATMPSADHMPVPMSISDEPTRTPGRPGSPVMLIEPARGLHERVVARLSRERPDAAVRADEQ